MEGSVDGDYVRVSRPLQVHAQRVCTLLSNATMAMMGAGDPETQIAQTGTKTMGTSSEASWYRRKACTTGAPPLSGWTGRG